MKILLTTHQFLPDFSAGTEILTFETARELQRLGHEVSVFTGFPGSKELKDSERFDSYRYEEIQVERFYHAFVAMGKQINIIEAQYNNLFFAAFFRKCILKLQPQIVHFFHLQRLSAAAIDVCYDLGIPTVFTPTDFWLVCFTNQLRMAGNLLCTGPDDRGVNCLRHLVSRHQSPSVNSLIRKLPDWLIYAMIRFISIAPFVDNYYFRSVRALAQRPAFMKQRMNKLSRVIAPTQLMVKILTEHGLLPDKIIFSPFGINLAPFLHSVRKAAKGHLRIGYIGTLSEHKGVHLLLKAFRTLPKNEMVDLKIYGKSDDFPEYVAELRQIAGDDPRIRFCGTFPNSQIGDIFSDLDVLVVPSIWYENTPLVIYSAHAAGCPVIASNLGGMSEVVHDGENGLLFEPGDVSGLAEALKHLSSDKMLLRKLTDNIKQPKSIEGYVTELIDVYKGVFKEIRDVPRGR